MEEVRFIGDLDEEDSDEEEPVPNEDFFSPGEVAFILSKWPKV